MLIVEQIIIFVLVAINLFCATFSLVGYIYDPTDFGWLGIFIYSGLVIYFVGGEYYTKVLKEGFIR